MRIEENIKYGILENDFLDVYYPETEEFDILIWFHGGGLESGNRKDILFVEDLVKEGMAVVSVEYRLYPEAIFPEFITDCARAVKYVLDHIAVVKGANRVFVSGQSAGAYITMMLAMDKKYLEQVGVDRKSIAGFVSDSSQMTVHFNVLRECGLDTRLERIDEASPLYYLGENCFDGNLLMIYYENDICCRKEQNLLFYKSIKRFCQEQRIVSVELPGGHCNGSANRNEKGTYDFNDVLLKFTRQNILSIGNSFSQDAHKWLHKLALDNGIDLQTANLYIGGCSLEMHWENAKEDNAYYDYEINGNAAEQKISIMEALKLKKWDVITLQQVSQLSGIYESYEPYLSSLVELIREVQPEAKILFHQTWAYEIDSNHSGFANYNNNQTEMYYRIKDTTENAAQSVHVGLIPSGNIIQTLRETVPEFNYKQGGLSLCRDGFHLSEDYGRFAAAATWLHTISDIKIETTNFENFDSKLLNKIIDVVNQL